MPHYSSSYDLINTKELGRGVAEALGESAYALFPKNHGVVFCGKSTEHATLMAIFLEKVCHAQLVIRSSGVKWSWSDDDGTANVPPGPD